MNSAIYEGWVGHRRHDPISHEFRYPLFMTYLDLAELPGALDRFPGWSASGRALARFRRADFLGPADRPLDECVRAAVTDRGGVEPRGPIRLLTTLRYLGHCFNPVSFYYCFDEVGDRVESVLAEVTNTPWGERHSYLLGAAEGEDRVIRGKLDKAFHVSPLMGMDHSYDWRTTEPGAELHVHIDSRAPGANGATFEATLRLRRHELRPATMRRVLWRYPALSMQVVAKIYWQSLRLKLKGAVYHPHPERG